MAKQLTEHKVRSLTGKPSRYRITEDNLQLEVNPSGRRVWFCQGRANGKRFRRHLGEYPKMNVKAAREAVRKILTERDSGTRIIEDPSSFEAFVEGQFRDWCEGSRKQGTQTMKRLRHTHLPTFGLRKLRDITQQDIERHKARLLKTKQPATVKRDLGDLRRVFAKAKEWGLLRRSPTEAVSDPNVEHSEKLYLTEAELSHLQAALIKWESLHEADQKKRLAYTNRTGKIDKSRHRYHPDLPLIVRIIVNTGLRRNEVLSLERRDLHLGDGTAADPSTITVRPEVAKSERRRVIPINDKLAQHLAVDREQWTALKKSKPKASLFRLRYIAKAWAKLRKMAELEHVTLHHLRHNFASQLVLKGAAPSVIQRLMGHTSIETTMLYFSVRKEDEIEAVNLL